MGMNLLVVGAGGREHAIGRALLQSDLVMEVFCAPGNPGMHADGITCVAVPETDHTQLIEFARTHDVAWVFVGPEVPLINGIVDDLTAAGIPAFGPTRAAAQIEGSKDFAKSLMARHGIPTAAYRTFTDLASARAYVIDHGAPVVVKADGLAAGKGVTVALSVDVALDALDDIFVTHRFGKAGAKVVIEDFLEGQEFSLMSFVRGTEVWPMPIAQDHKRAHDGDTGPNTGGMGAYSPVPQIPQAVVDEAMEKIVQPTVDALAEEGTPFTGVLYAGLIATSEGPKVIEYNARFGDPETQVVLPRLTSDLARGITDLLEGSEPVFSWNKSGVTLGVVLAAEGYPGAVIHGAPVPQFAVARNEHIYYAGVEDSTDGLAAAGGRVLLIAATESSLTEAQHAAYARLNEVDTTGFFYRHDIGTKALD